MEFLGSLGAWVFDVEHDLDPSYLIANKMACIDVETSADKIIFLDSDILCIREFHHQARFERFQFAAKLADLADLPRQHWRTICRALGEEFTEFTHRSTVTCESIPLYFNSGMIAVTNGLGLGKRWVQVARRIDANPEVPRKRPFLDQIALPFAVRELDLSVDLLGEDFNFPAGLRPLPRFNRPFFCHYHLMDHVFAEQDYCRLVQMLCTRHPRLKEILSLSEDGRRLLRLIAM